MASANMLSPSACRIEQNRTKLYSCRSTCQVISQTRKCVVFTYAGHHDLILWQVNLSCCAHILSFKDLKHMQTQIHCQARKPEMLSVLAKSCFVVSTELVTLPFSVHAMMKFQRAIYPLHVMTVVFHHYHRI